MGKGSRTRQFSAIDREEKKQEERKYKKKSKIKRIIVGSICTVVALSIAGYGVYYGINSYNVKNGDYIRKVSVVTSDNCKINGAMMTYITYDTYKKFCSQNSSNLSNYGLDTTKDIKEQNYKDNQTWFDYFYDQSKENAQQLAAYYNAAIDKGLTLSDTDEADIESDLNKINIGDYGKGVKIDDVRDYLKIQYLSKKYYAPLVKEFKPSIDEIQNYYNDNSKNFMKFSYASYQLKKSDFKNDNDYNEWCDKLKKSNSLDSFKTSLKDCLVTGCSLEESDAESKLDSIETTDAKYKDDDSASKWALEDDRKLYETFYEDTDDGSTVYMLTALPTRDETPSINVRHILFNVDKYGSTTKTKKKAEEIYNEFLSGEKTSDSFAKLAKEYSGDPGSAEDGGLYENVTEGKMVQEFNDWCFDKTRAIGDCDIVKTDYGYHIMYFEGQGLYGWQSEVSDTIVKDKYTREFDDYKEKYNVKFNDKAIGKLR